MDELYKICDYYYNELLNNKDELSPVRRVGLIQEKECYKKTLTQFHQLLMTGRSDLRNIINYCKFGSLLNFDLLIEFLLTFYLPNKIKGPYEKNNLEKIQVETFYHNEWNNIHFDHMNLTNLKLEGMTLIDCLFTNCDLSNLDFHRSTIHRVHFKNCKLVGTDLSASSLQNVCIENSHAHYINFSKSKLKQIKILESDLTNGSMNECNIKDIELNNSNLQLMELFKTPLKDIDLRTCKIEGIKLTGPELNGAIVTTDEAIILSKLLGIIIED